MSTGIKRASAATLFMKADRAADSRAEQGDMRAKRPGAVDHRPGDEVDGAGTHQSGRDDQNQGDDDRGFVAEPVKGVLGRNGTERHGDQQGEKGDEIVAEPAP